MLPDQVLSEATRILQRFADETGRDPLPIIDTALNGRVPDMTTADQSADQSTELTELLLVRPEPYICIYI